MSTAIYYKNRRTTTWNVFTKYIKDRFCFGKVVFCPFVCREMAVLTDSTVILRLSLLQSETCEVYMPSLDFHIAAGTLGGRFTTLEGLLCNIKDQVRDTHLTLNIFYIAREIGVRVNTIGPEMLKYCESKLINQGLSRSPRIVFYQSEMIVPFVFLL